MAKRLAGLSIALALAACGSAGGDEPQPPPEEVSVFTSESAEGACLAAVGERVGDASLQVLASAGGWVTVGVGPTLTPWRCRLGPGGDVESVEAGPGGR